MDHDIFISYKSSSLPFVEKMAEMFKSNGVSCWYAPRDLDQSGAGKEYDDEIVEAIRKASAVVVILNDLALQSKWVKREIHQAEKQGKMIYPFVISELTINNGLLMRLEDVHLITAYPDPESKFPILLNNVKQLLGQDVPSVIINEKDENAIVHQVKLKNNFDFDFDEGMAFLEVDEERDAFLAFLRSAENGSEKAKEQLFKIMSRNARDMSFLDDLTWEHIEDLSDAGEAYADLLMHYKYYGMGAQNDIALKYLKRALNKQVSPYALLQMGICYGWGLGVSASDVLELLYYKKAYEAGCDAACSYIGQLYKSGGEKIKVDLQKAEAFLREGIERGDVRSYRILFSLFRDKKEYEKAMEVAQQMIDNNITGGYTLMGNYYNYVAPVEDRDEIKAKDFYKQAITHNEKDAWGNLAWLYWLNYDHDEAYEMARKGCREDDSISYFALGYFYEQDARNDDYSKAWDCYFQQVLKFGTDASPLANLYINYGYLPKDYSLEELKRLLMIDAKLQRYESIVCLLRIILKELGKASEISFDILCDLPETYEYIRMGAEMAGAEANNTELMYIYGRLQIEKSGKLHNPYKGVEMITLASKKGNLDAMDYAFSNNKDFDLSELANNAVSAKIYPIKHLDTILRNARSISSPEDLKAWISGAMKRIRGDVEQADLFFHLFQTQMELYKNGDKEEFKTWLSSCKSKLDGGVEKLQMRFLLYREELELYKNGNPIDLEYIKNDIESNRESIIMCGCLSLLKDYIDILYPDFNPNAILDGDFSDSNSFSLFYGFNRSRLDLFIVTNVDYETKITDLLHIDDLINNDARSAIIDTNEFCRAYGEMLQAYHYLVKAGKAIQIDEDLELDKSQISLFTPSKVIMHYCQMTMKMLIASRVAFGEEWQNIMNNIVDHGKLLDIAESMGDMEDNDDINNTQLVILEYVEAFYEGEVLLKMNNSIRTACKSHDKKLVCKELNERIAELDKHKIVHGLKKYVEDDIPETLFEDEVQNDFEENFLWPHFPHSFEVD